MGSRGPPGFWNRIYAVVENAMPWKYTGVYSHPEFKGHIPVVGATRVSPNNPPFTPITPGVSNNRVLDPKKYKVIAARNDLLKPVDIAEADLKRQQSWQDETPLGTARFRFKTNQGYIYEYSDNGYR